MLKSLLAAAIMFCSVGAADAQLPTTGAGKKPGGGGGGGATFTTYAPPASISGGSGATVTYTGSVPVGTGVRLVGLCIAWQSSNIDSTVTINGTAMTKAVSALNNPGSAAIYYLNDATGTSITSPATVVITNTNGINLTTIMPFSMTGMTATPVNSQTIVLGTTGDPGTVSALTVPTGGFGASCVVSSTNPTGTLALSGGGIVLDRVLPANGAGVAQAFQVALGHTSTAGSDSVTVTGGGNFSYGVAEASWGP